MVTKEQVMLLLLTACPSFFKRWEEQLLLYEEGDEQLLYLDLAEFADHLVELHKAHRIEEFPAVFQVVESLHLEGDHFVKEATTIGLLEGIQNQARNLGVDPEEFLQYLGAQSLRWWRQLNDFWNAKIPYVGATIDEA
jgi:hypothetical protein